MDPLAFLSWQFVMFSLFVAVIMQILRTILEYFFPRLTTLKIWNSLLLMLLPIFIGALLGKLLPTYPFATGFTTTFEHIGYGAVAGLLSTVLFKVIKELLVGKVTGLVGGVMNTIGIGGTQTIPPPPPPPNTSIGGTGSLMGSPPNTPNPTEERIDSQSSK